jgi:hypothetical protein
VENQRLKELERILGDLSRGEKAQLLQWVVRDLGDAHPGIESEPSVCGGAATIVRTRIPVWVLEQARRLGMSEALARVPFAARGGSGERVGLRA